MPPNASIRPFPELVPEQEFLTGYVFTVFGPVEFRVWKKLLERINLNPAVGAAQNRVGL